MQLRRQAAAHSDHISDVLEVQKSELSRVHERYFTITYCLLFNVCLMRGNNVYRWRSLDEAVLSERTAYQKDMAKVLGRVGAIEQAVEERAQIHEVGQ